MSRYQIEYSRYVNASLSSEAWLGLDKLCWHNFENNRYPKALENYARIIGISIQTCENNKL